MMEVGPLVETGEINAVPLGGAPSKALGLKFESSGSGTLY